MKRRSLHRMTLRNKVIHGGSHAQSRVYRQSQGCPRTHGRPARTVGGPETNQRQMYTLGSDSSGLRRGSSTHVAVRRLRANEGRTVGRNRAASALDHIARVRQLAKRRQSGPGQRCAQVPAQTQTTRRHRSPFGSLLWLAYGRSQGDLPLAGQSRHAQLSRLRQRLRGVSRPAFHDRIDAGRVWREDETDRAAAVGADTQDVRSAWSFAARSRVLLDRRDSLFAAGAGAVLDAGGRAWTQAERGRAAHGHPRVSKVESKWLGPTHAAGRQSQGDRVDLRALRQPPGQTEKARPLRLGLRLLGLQAGFDKMGKRYLSKSLRHRNELSAVERGAHQDVYAQSGGAILLHRLGVDPAQCMGLVPLGTPVDAAAWTTPSATGANAFQSDVVVVVACGGSTPWRLRSEERRVGKECRSRW